MFDNMVGIITGGSSGIGKAVAERLLKKGANLALLARNEEKLKAAKSELEGCCKTGRRLEVFSCDISDAASAKTTVKAIADKLGTPEMLINSAGILRESQFENQSIETFHEIMDTNFFGTLHMIKAVLPYFQEQGRGRILNVSSVAGLMGVYGYSAYCSSKHAITGLTHSLRSELKPQGIQMHIVYPPETKTPMLDDVKNRTEVNKKVTHTIPVLTVEVVADAIIRGIERGQYEIVPGAITRTLTRFDRWLPGVSRVVVDSRISKYYKK